MICQICEVSHKSTYILIYVHTIHTYICTYVHTYIRIYVRVNIQILRYHRFNNTKDLSEHASERHEQLVVVSQEECIMNRKRNTTLPIYCGCWVIYIRTYVHLLQFIKCTYVRTYVQKWVVDKRTYYYHYTLIEQTTNIYRPDSRSAIFRGLMSQGERESRMRSVSPRKMAERESGQQLQTTYICTYVCTYQAKEASKEQIEIMLFPLDLKSTQHQCSSST